MIEEFAKLIPNELLSRSGLVFYSGRTAFSVPSEIYLLGYNPGVAPELMPDETIQFETDKILTEYPSKFSAYQDISWVGKTIAEAPMQVSILHMLGIIGFDPQCVPSSNLIFVRSQSVETLKAEASELEEKCWPFHQSVIERLGVKLIICFGNDCGRSVRKRLDATKIVGRFKEQNNRGWKSEAYMNGVGQIVVQVTHPSRANWTNPLADPTPLVFAMLNQQYGYGT